MSYPPCPNCNSQYVYKDRENLVCPECGNEWNPSDNIKESEFIVRDSNGNILQSGDKITLIRDLKVKGSSQGLKIGSKTIVRKIIEGKDHQLDCKFPGIGEVMVTAKFVKKA